MVIIDILYISDIKEGLNKVILKNNNEQDFIIELEKECFPYGGGSIIGYYKIQDFNQCCYELDIHDIKTLDEANIDEKEILMKETPIFSLDSGIFLIIDVESLIKLARTFDYDTLIESDNYGLLNSSYISEITTLVGGDFYAIISTPGIGKGYDLTGSGTYTIPTEKIKSIEN